MAAQLQISQVDGRSVVVGARAETPLALLNPSNHGHGAWVYQSSHGGGFVAADAVTLNVEVEEGATLFLSSQASSKVYRSARSRFVLEAAVAEGAALIHWPDPVACFAGASFHQVQRFELSSSASLLCVDAYTAGRVARGERWAFERYHSRTRVEREGRLCFHEATLLVGEHGVLEARMADAEAAATVILSGPRLRGAIDALEDAEGASRTASGLVLRRVAPTVEALHASLRGELGPHVAALLGDDPHARKW